MPPQIQCRLVALLFEYPRYLNFEPEEEGILLHEETGDDVLHEETGNPILV